MFIVAAGGEVVSEYRRYNLTLTVVDPSARGRFRALSRPESFFEIRPNRSPGQRGAYSVEMTQDEYEAALEDAANPDMNLIAVEVNRPLKLASSGAGGAPDEGTLSYVAAQDADSLSLDGSGVTVAVLDTGLGAALRNGVFSGRVAGARSFIGGDPFVDSLDTFGGYHGSNMASLAVPPGASIAVGQVNSDYDDGSEDTGAAGIYWAADEMGADVINCSFIVSGTSMVIGDAVADAASRNVIVVGAAGNNGVNEVNYPAAHPNCYAISNYDPRTDAKSPDSSYGSYLWAAAPGRNLYVLEANGALVYKDNRGSSAAAAVASGLVARMLTGGRSPGNAMKYLADNARPTGASPLYEGNGVLQLTAAEQQLQQDKPGQIDLAGDPIMEDVSLGGTGGDTPGDIPGSGPIESAAQDGTGNPDPGACGDKGGSSSPTPAQYRLDISYYDGGDPDWGLIRTCLLAVGWSEDGAGVTSASDFRGFGGYGDDIVPPPSTVCAQALSITAGWTTEEFQVTDSEGPITTYWLVPPSDWQV